MPELYSAIRGLFRTLAEAWNLRETDQELATFREMFEVIASNRYRGVLDGDRLEARTAVIQLAREALNGTGDNAAGRSAIAWRPVAERYVVFSDHHILPDRCRADFFSSNNGNIYAKALAKYYDAGYTLVENGDVEDLVIFEPTLERARRRSGMTLAELNDDRRAFRRNQLRDILSEERNRPYLDQVRRFARDQRFVRIVGNHDYDVQSEALYEVWSSADFLAGAPRPVDALFLHDGARPPSSTVRGSGRNPPHYVITHGHQFDPACNPVSAPLIGEPTSECLGVYFQGPDRLWLAEHDDNRGRPAGSDGVHLYGTGVGTPGEEAMRNLLVTADPSEVDVAGMIARLAPALLGPLGAAGAIALLARTPELEVRGIFEALFSHNIAWEYFRSDRAVEAIRDEVLGGARFFKYRHMDEVDVATRWEQEFRGAPRTPTLVLGHTHEARIQPHFRLADGGGPISHYLNSGAAGRFAGMLWAIEIDAGVPRLVTWTMGQGSPTERSQAVRREVDPVVIDGMSQLRTQTETKVIPR